MCIISGTDCCALYQISEADNDTTVKEIAECIEDITSEDGDMFGRAVFVVTKADEYKLVSTLKRMRFKRTATFSRRYEYDQTPLTMWLLKLNYKRAYNNMIKEQNEYMDDNF